MRMIHQLLVIDRRKSIGLTLFDDGQLILQSDLLIGLVQALMVLGEEMGPVKGSLREAELGQYQISILSKDHLAYVAIQDTYDSEPFTRNLMEGVVDEYHTTLSKSNLHVQLKKEQLIKKGVVKLLTTMQFPVDKLEETRELIIDFVANHSVYVDALLLADLDDGIIDIILQPESERIIRLLMEILSEIPFERHWVGQTRLHKPLDNGQDVYDYELWMIYRVKDTDFCLLGRAYYRDEQERKRLISDLEGLTELIAGLL